MISKSETTLVKQIIQYLNYRGCYVWRQNTGGNKSEYKYKTGWRKGKTQSRFIHYGFKGISDIVGVAPDGKGIFIECKIGSNKPTQFQKDFLESVDSRGAIALCVWDFEAVEKYFDEHYPTE